MSLSPKSRLQKSLTWKSRGFPLFGGDDARKFEPKYDLIFNYLNKTISKLRAIHKDNPGWFEVPKPKLDEGKNMVEYSVK